MTILRSTHLPQALVPIVNSLPTRLNTLHRPTPLSHPRKVSLAVEWADCQPNVPGMGLHGYVDCQPNFQGMGLRLTAIVPWMRKSY
eukprot:s3552_g5.t1